MTEQQEAVLTIRKQGGCQGYKMEYGILTHIDTNRKWRVAGVSRTEDGCYEPFIFPLTADMPTAQLAKIADAKRIISEIEKSAWNEKGELIKPDLNVTKFHSGQEPRGVKMACKQENKVKAVCTACGVVFERSKFNPSQVWCPDCRQKNKKTGKKEVSKTDSSDVARVCAPEFRKEIVGDVA